MRVLTLDVPSAPIVSAKGCLTLIDATDKSSRNAGTQIETYATKHFTVASATIPRFEPEILQYSYPQQHTHQMS